MQTHPENRDANTLDVGGAGELDDGRQVASAAYVLYGDRWPAGQTTLTWSFNDYILLDDDPREESLGRSLTEDLREIVRDAMDAWEAVCGVRFVEVPDSPSADVRIGWQPTFAVDPQYNSDGPGGTSAAAWRWFFGRETDQASVVFDNAERWGPGEFYDAALHELGHVLGIDHSDIRNTVMSGLPNSPYADLNPAGRDALTPDDIAAAQALWGPPQPSPFTPQPPPSTRGTPGNDTLRGSSGDDILHGEGGNDRLLGGAGNDFVTGGPGNDRLWGEDGHDTLWGGDGVDILFGLNGNDDIDGDYGRDIILGGAGDDSIHGDYGPEDDGTTAASGDGDDAVWAEAGNDTVWGEGGHDFLAGGTGNDELYGEGGDDYLAGGGGDDFLFGGSGYNTLAGGAGDDTLVGGADGGVFFGQGGRDHFEYNGGTVWVMDRDSDDMLWFGNGASVVGRVQQGEHLRIDMSDGGEIWLARTDLDDGPFF